VITLSTIKQYVASVVDPLRARVNGMVRRAVLSSLSNTSGLAAGSFSITDEDTDVADEVEVLSPVGVSSRPKKNAEAILLAVGGNPAVRVAIPFVRGQRLTGGDISDDEVALYIGQAGQVVHLKADGSVLVRSKDVGGGDGGSITLKANGDIVAVPSATGKVLIGDEAASKKLALDNPVAAALADLRTAFNQHTHPTAPVGPVSPPTAIPGVIPVPAPGPLGSTNVYGKG
jgi:phage gp45-like